MTWEHKYISLPVFVFLFLTDLFLLLKFIFMLKESYFYALTDLFLCQANIFDGCALVNKSMNNSEGVPPTVCI